MRRRKGEALRPDYVIPTVKFGGGKVSVWACLHADGVGPIVRINGNLNGERFHSILTTHTIPYLKKLDRELENIDLKTLSRKRKRQSKDEEAVHSGPFWPILAGFSSRITTQNTNRGRICSVSRGRRQIPMLTYAWPSQSPDLNPLESL